MSIEGPLAAGRQRDDDLRKRLTIRIAIAVVLILGAVLALEWLDRLGAPPKGEAKVEKALPLPAETQKADVPAPATPPVAATEPEPAKIEAEGASASEPGPKREVSPEVRADAVTREPGGALPDRSAARVEPGFAAGARPEREPVLKLSEPATPPRAKEPVAAPVPREGTAAPKEAVVPPARSAEPQGAARAQEPTKAGPRGFHVQMGVFQSAANAEELRARLVANGVPAYTETRVHVGPFKDRAEAERMREKLRAMGLAGLVQPAP